MSTEHDIMKVNYDTLNIKYNDLKIRHVELIDIYCKTTVVIQHMQDVIDKQKICTNIDNKIIESLVQRIEIIESQNKNYQNVIKLHEKIIKINENENGRLTNLVESSEELEEEHKKVATILKSALRLVMSKDLCEEDKIKIQEMAE